MTIALVATHAVHPRRLDAFHRWADRWETAAAAQPGFVAGVRLEQPGGLVHLVQQFDAPGALARWQEAAGYRELVGDGEALSVTLRETATGEPPHIEVPAESSAPRWKNFLVTWIAVLPVLLAISSAIRALLPGWPPLAQTAISSLFLTGALNTIILPPIQRRARAWMLSNASGRLHR